MWLLENWAEWMQCPSHKLGYPSQSLCISSGGASGVDEFEIMCDGADISCAISLDSIIDSLSMPQRIAINHQWLKVAHHYPTHDMDIFEAYEAIMRLCNKRGVI